MLTSQLSKQNKRKTLETKSNLNPKTNKANYLNENKTK